MYLTEITQISALAAQINSINFTLKGSPVRLVDLRQTPQGRAQTFEKGGATSWRLVPIHELTMPTFLDMNM